MTDAQLAAMFSDVIKFYDRDLSGDLDVKELGDLLAAAGLKLTPKQVCEGRNLACDTERLILLGSKYSTSFVARLCMQSNLMNVAYATCEAYYTFNHCGWQQRCGCHLDSNNDKMLCKVLTIATHLDTDACMCMCMHVCTDIPVYDVVLVIYTVPYHILYYYYISIVTYL